MVRETPKETTGGTSVEITFNVVVERDEEGYYIATVPELRGCHTQARSLDTLMDRIREAIDLCIEEQGRPLSSTEFVGVRRVTAEL
jgi:predicted RNase H-like HicB family nuclease